jgi:hypothetical protein
MICPDCSALLPHDLPHVQEHAAICTGSTVENFFGRFMLLCASIERMATAGGVLGQPSSCYGPNPLRGRGYQG